MSFSGKMAITTFKLMQNAKSLVENQDICHIFLDTLYIDEVNW